MMVLVVLPNDCETLRIGVVAGRSIGNAVQRNRAKRLLRHAAQALMPSIMPGLDMILIARQPIIKASMSQARTVLDLLLRRSNTLQEHHELENV